MKSPAKQQQEIKQALIKFYNQPVAKVSFELFLSLAAILFFAIFAIRPTLLTMSDLLKEIEDKKLLDEQLAQKVAALSTVQTEYIQLQSRLEILNESIPNQPNLIYSMKVIERIASDLNLIILSASVPEIPDENPVDVSMQDPDNLRRVNLPVSISVAGDYPTIRQFVERLRNYRRSFVIDTIVFRTQEQQGSTNLEARITVTMPYYTDQPEEAEIK